MTTEEARRLRQLQLIEETEIMIETLGRLEDKIDLDHRVVAGTRSAVNLALVAVLASIVLWYGQARAQSDSTAFTKCVATWADLSTKAQTARGDAAATRLKFEKARGDAVSHSAADLIKGVNPRKALGEIKQAQTAYDRAYQNYQDTIAKNPIPESPKFSCQVAPFHITQLQYYIGAGILLLAGLIAMSRLARAVLRRLMWREKDDRGSRHSRSRKQKARGEAGRQEQAKTGIRPSPRGRP